ncbi:ATP-binding protein [Streptomyces altiplanensis]
MSDSTNDYPPHPHIGGRTNALRALAAWRMEWPGAPRVVALTGDSGSGRSRLLTGFLMLCDPDFRKQLHLDQLDPSTVPPELPAPAAANARGLTTAQFLWALADHYGLSVDRAEDIYAELAALREPIPLIVLDVDQAGPVRTADEASALVHQVLKPFAALGTTRLVAELPRHLAAELAEGLPSGTVQIIDLDAPQWADAEGLVRHAYAALSPQFAGPELPFTEDPQVRSALAAAIARRAGTSPLVVQLAVQGILTTPGEFDPTDEQQLPSSVCEALDLHARRLGADPQTLRLLLAPLALAEGDGVPVELWAPLASAVAGRDMSESIASGMLLAGSFVRPAPDETEETDTPERRGERTLLRLVHPAVGEEICAGLPNVRAAQGRIAMALLEAVPDQDWGKADAYIRDHIAGHALGADLLPQLLTDPGLFVHAAPVPLRAALEALPPDALGAPGRTYLRTAALLTRNELPALGRAALLETAFVEDGLVEYANAIHRLGIDLPWQTLWSTPLPGISDVTIAELPMPEGAAQPVAILVVPANTPGARPVNGPEKTTTAEQTGVIVHDLIQPLLLSEVDPAQIVRPGENARAAAPLGLSRGADYLRVWDRKTGEAVTALISETPFIGADLSPSGILLVATARGAKALRIRATDPAIAS